MAQLEVPPPAAEARPNGRHEPAPAPSPGWAGDDAVPRGLAVASAVTLRVIIVVGGIVLLALFAKRMLVVVLPVAIGAIDFRAPLPPQRVVVSAREVRRDTDSFEWDLDLAAADGTVVERWRGLRLHVVARRTAFDDLPPDLERLRTLRVWHAP